VRAGALDDVRRAGRGTAPAALLLAEPFYRACEPQLPWAHLMCGALLAGCVGVRCLKARVKRVAGACCLAVAAMGAVEEQGMPFYFMHQAAALSNGIMTAPCMGHEAVAGQRCCCEVSADPHAHGEADVPVC